MDADAYFEQVAPRWKTTGAGEEADPEAVAERGAALFSEGFYCAESVLQAVAESHGLRNAALSRIATGFCSGMSRTSGMCGALSGGIMALGLLTGRAAPGDDKGLCYTLTYHLVGHFRERFKSIACSDLLGCDIGTAEGARRFEQERLEESVCVRVTREVARMATELLSLRHRLRHPLLSQRELEPQNEAFGS